MKLQLLLSLVWIIISLSIQAEVILDGTLGRSGALSGPDYFIGAKLGQQHGGNLFHSFQDFNLQSFESATFAGPETINNIISRVTGGNPSQIDGMLRSTIPNANLYFLNPYGIMLGPNAKLDVQGSFHASTADYLRLGNGGRFDARQPSNSLLTVAPIEAFGFVTDSPASLSIKGSQLSNRPNATISLIGGTLALEKARLKIPQGQINLASVGSTGEVILTQNGFDMTTVSDLNQINMTDNSVVTTSGKGAGRIFIQGETLTLQQSKIKADALEQGNKGKIDIQVERLNLIGNSQLGKIHYDKIAFDTAISSSTISEGDGGDIFIQATDAINITNAAIFANSGRMDIQREAGSTTSMLPEYPDKQGNAGSIFIETEQLTVDNAVIESNAFGSGQGGHITLNITNNTSLSDSHISVNAFDGSEVNADRVGEIILETKQLDLANVILSSSTFGSGAGGNIILMVDGAITLSHSAIVVDAHANMPPPSNYSPTKPSQVNQINSRPAPPSGDAGSIHIEAGKIILSDRSNISSNTSGTGDGGHIIIYATDSVTIQNPHHTTEAKNAKISQKRFGIEAISISQQEDSGDAGEIWLETSRLNLTEDADMNTSSQGGGDAGHISLTVTDLNMRHHTKIASSNQGMGDAGNVVINTQNLLLQQDTKITTEAKSAEGGEIRLNVGKLVYLHNGRITTSVRGGTGNGGDITLENPHFVVLNQGQIKAQAFQGNGGDIDIISHLFLASSDSLVSASSKLGVNGEVDIDSPDINIDEFLVVLPGKFFDASKQLQSPCLARHQKHNFIVKRFVGSPPSPQDWKATQLVLLPTKAEEQKPSTLSPQNQNAPLNEQTTLKVAFLTVCHPDLFPTDNQTSKESSVISQQLF